jgi:hypothetical protein
LSAQTGNHLADDHDIHSFEVYDLNPAARTVDPKRPTEEAHIKAGHEFKMNEEIKEKIKKTEGRIRSYEKEHEDHDDHFDDHAISVLEENQFKIIESLNILLARVDIDQIKIHGGDGGSHKVENGGAMAKDVAALEERVRDVTRSVGELTVVVKEAFDKMLKGGDHSELQECKFDAVNV